MATNIILNYFLKTFETIAVQFVSWIPFVIAIWILFDLIGGLLFNKR